MVVVVCCRGNYTEVWGYTAYMPSCALLPWRFLHKSLGVVSEYTRSFMHTWPVGDYSMEVLMRVCDATIASQILMLHIILAISPQSVANRLEYNILLAEYMLLGSLAMRMRYCLMNLDRC